MSGGQVVLLVVAVVVLALVAVAVRIRKRRVGGVLLSSQRSDRT